MADISTWSTTAASNNTASPDGWPESMAPSGVNNSARENMAQIATWRQKFGGWMMENVGLSATVGGGDLTVTLRVKDGSSSPSSTNKVGIGFRNATLTTGGFTYVEATSAINVTLPSGGTLGFANSATGYVYVYAINNAGTMELAVAGSSLFDEGIVHTSTGIGTGSDSATVLYSGSGRTDVPIRLIGRITIQHGTGSWTNSPTVTAFWSPGVARETAVTVESDQSISLGGSFSTSARLIVTKFSSGRICNLYIPISSHSSGAGPASDAGVIPSAYRPDSASAESVYKLGTGIIKSIAVSTAGTVSFLYKDYAGTNTADTSTGHRVHLSWFV